MNVKEKVKIKKDIEKILLCQKLQVDYLDFVSFCQKFRETLIERGRK